MGTLKEDIKKQTVWIVNKLNSDGYNLDYSMHSLLDLDKFLQNNTRNGNPVKGGQLTKNVGLIVFSIGSYIGETFIKNIPGTEWITDDNDPQGEINAAIKFPDGTIIWPMQKVIKRFKLGFEDSLYPYGQESTKKFLNEPFDQSFWEISKSNDQEIKKTWWKFWS
jgi:hypothetical protein